MTIRQSSSADKAILGAVARAAAFALLAGALAGCRSPSPPPPAKTVLPVPPPFAAPSFPERVGASWSFAITESGCVAHASNRDVSLTLRVGPNDRAELSVTGIALQSVAARAGARARLRFDGAAGSWTLAARSDSHHAVAAVLKLGETVAHDILLLLAGGSLRTELGKTRVPVLRIPDSDVSGRDWFDCVRREIRRVEPGS